MENLPAYCSILYIDALKIYLYISFQVIAWIVSGVFFFLLGGAVQHVECQFPNQELNLSHWQWKLKVLTTRPPGNSLVWSELCSPQNSHVENLTSEVMVRRWDLWEMKQSWGRSPHEWDWCRRSKGELLCRLLTFHVSPTFLRQGFSACSPSFCSVGRNSKEKNSPCSQIPEGHNWCLSCWYNGQEESETWS